MLFDLRLELLFDFELLFIELEFIIFEFEFIEPFIIIPFIADLKHQIGFFPIVVANDEVGLFGKALEKMVFFNL